MSGELIRQFFDKHDDAEKLRKEIEIRLNGFFATLRNLRGYDNERRERWRSVATTTMTIPSHMAHGPLIVPKDWLTLGELGKLLNSWHVAMDELGKSWRRLPYPDQQRFANDEPPDY